VKKGIEEDDGFAQSRLEALEMFRADGYDVRGTLEWPVAWGDCDMFQYVFSFLTSPSSAPLYPSPSPNTPFIILTYFSRGSNSLVVYRRRIMGMVLMIDM
jgi:hypothetical protein